MSYTALYRKWRPERFPEVKGQDAIVRTLKNQINADRIGHAYLFCGTRGTGKTTLAKIMAKAVNCEHPVDGSPCNECACCRKISAGSSMNVVEIDAASNNGVDNIREIIDEVAYSPTEGRYRVYIIDEAHMLSPGAFNALLKTLEEPPSYVIFILATTEVHKIPVTILSRCQRYDFKRISVDTITARLNELLVAEGIEAEEKAVRYIARSADGALRDALSLLDQCAAFYLGEELTYEKVLEAVGAVDTAVFSALLRSVTASDVAGAIGIIDDAVNSGRNLAQFVMDFTWYLRNLMLLKSADESEDVSEAVDMSKEGIGRLTEEAVLVPMDTLMRYIRICSELSNDLRYANMKRVLVEMAVVKLCRPDMERDDTSLLERIRVLEEKIEKGVIADVPVQNNLPEEEVTPKYELPKALSEDIKQLVRMWPDIVADMPGGLKIYLRKARLSAREDNKLTIVVKNDQGNVSEFLNRDYQRDGIAACLSKALGKEVEFEIVGLEGEENFGSTYTDLFSAIMAEVEIDDSV